MCHFTTDSHFQDVALLRGKPVEVLWVEEVGVKWPGQIELPMGNNRRGWLWLKLCKHLAGTFLNLCDDLLQESWFDQMGRPQGCIPSKINKLHTIKGIFDRLLQSIEYVWVKSAKIVSTV
jgi:hypothetical protein